jgi:predicted exporter
MPERKNTSARTALCRVICVLLLAATAAACDACGDLRLQADQQLQACRDAPKPN